MIIITRTREAGDGCTVEQGGLARNLRTREAGDGCTTEQGELAKNLRTRGVGDGCTYSRTGRASQEPEN